MRSAHWFVAAAVSCAATGAWALEGDGLMPSSATPWPRWQGRLSLAAPSALPRADASEPDRGGHKLLGATVLGDYYFTRSLPRLGDSGGFRATGGMFVGARSATLLSTTPGAGQRLRVDRRSVGGLQLPGTADAPLESGGAVPYVGLGYTGLPSRGGWGFSADLGLMALSPGSAVKFGRAFGNPQNLDDALRELRLSPLVQVGVSYSF